jgi:3-hydroxyacyl-[acyl-carrier-protein] dehydratase
MIDPFALLPHRDPFLLVDRIELVTPGQHAIGTKMVTGAEWCAISGRAADGALAMPHLLIVEALAQLSAAVLVGLLDAPGGAIGYFMGIDRVRFRRAASPGDTLDLSVELKQFRRGVCRTLGVATVDGELVVQAELTTILRAAKATA